MSAPQCAAFDQLFFGGGDAVLFARAMEGKLRSCAIRGVVWRYFLGMLPRGPPTLDL